MKVIDWICRSNEFRQKLEERRDRLYRVAYSWCHNPDLSDDLVQDTMTKALRNGKQLQDINALDSWLFRILRNCWCDHLRKSKDTEEFDENYHQHHDTPELLNSRLETINKVRRAIERLPLGQREVLTLVDLEGFSYAEVADIMEIPVGTVMSRLCRARRALTEFLSDETTGEKPQVARIRRVK